MYKTDGIFKDHAIPNLKFYLLGCNAMSADILKDCCLLLADSWLGLLFDSEDGGSMFI
jgi:hypothetical protein